MTSAANSVRQEKPAPTLISGSAGHLLVTEPHNIFLARQEQIERAYEELEEAHRR